MPEPEIGLFHIIYGTITTQDPDTAAQIIYDFVVQEMVAHARHAAEFGCEHCKDLVERWSEAVAASHEADARREEFNTSIFESMVNEMVSHMTLEDDLHGS